MQEISSLGKPLILSGIVIIIIGVLLLLAGKFSWLGKIPGDIIIKRDNFTGYFMFGTSILLSVILTLIMLLFTRK